LIINTKQILLKIVYCGCLLFLLSTGAVVNAKDTLIQQVK